MIQETELSPNHLIYPVFVKEMAEKKVPIPAMPDVYQFSVEGLPQEIEDVVGLSIPAILLFGIPEKKDETGTGAYNEHGIVQKAARVIKKLFGNDIIVITDVCMCEYTSHGHCGIIKDGDVDNDETLKVLARSALSHAAAGADMVAPSDMMDGRVKVIRETLDISGYTNIPIMSYAAKYSSALYGPFREAAESAPPVRRPAGVPDGSAKPAGSPPRDQARYRRRCRYHYGKTCPILSRCPINGAT